MSSSLSFLASEFPCSTSEATQYTNVSFLLSRPLVRVSCLIEKDDMKALNRYRGGRNVRVCCQLVPSHLQESYKRKKRPQVPKQKLDFVRTLLIDNYDSYTYNIYQALSVINGVPPVVIRNDEWTWEELCHYLYEEYAFDNIVISPGPGSPSCPEDIGDNHGMPFWTDNFMTFIGSKRKIC